MRRAFTAGALADAVYSEVARERQLEKTAASAYTGSGELTTDLGRQLRKVAERVRQEATEEISYEDLQEFRARYGS